MQSRELDPHPLVSPTTRTVIRVAAGRNLLRCSGDQYQCELWLKQPVAPQESSAVKPPKPIRQRSFDVFDKYFEGAADATLSEGPAQDSKASPAADGGVWDPFGDSHQPVKAESAAAAAPGGPQADSAHSERPVIILTAQPPRDSKTPAPAVAQPQTQAQAAEAKDAPTETPGFHTVWTATTDIVTGSQPAFAASFPLRLDCHHAQLTVIYRRIINGAAHPCGSVTVTLNEAKPLHAWLLATPINAAVEREVAALGPDHDCGELWLHAEFNHLGSLKAPKKKGKTRPQRTDAPPAKAPEAAAPQPKPQQQRADQKTPFDHPFDPFDVVAPLAGVAAAAGNIAGNPFDDDIPAEQLQEPADHQPNPYDPAANSLGNIEEAAAAARAATAAVIVQMQTEQKLAEEKELEEKRRVMLRPPVPLSQFGLSPTIQWPRSRWSRANPPPNFRPPPGIEPGLQIKVRAGRSIMVKDKWSASSDPYCILSIGRVLDAFTHERFAMWRDRTVTVRKSLNPVWNYAWVVSPKLDIRNCVLNIECFDHNDTLSDTLIGFVELELEAVRLHPVDGWLPLRKTKKGGADPKQGQRGDLWVSVSYLTPEAAKAQYEEHYVSALIRSIQDCDATPSIANRPREVYPDEMPRQFDLHAARMNLGGTKRFRKNEVYLDLEEIVHSFPNGLSPPTRARITAIFDHVHLSHPLHAIIFGYLEEPNNEPWALEGLGRIQTTAYLNDWPTMKLGLSTRSFDGRANDGIKQTPVQEVDVKSVFRQVAGTQPLTNVEPHRSVDWRQWEKNPVELHSGPPVPFPFYFISYQFKPDPRQLELMFKPKVSLEVLRRGDEAAAVIKAGQVGLRVAVTLLGKMDEGMLDFWTFTKVHCTLPLPEGATASNTHLESRVGKASLDLEAPARQVVWTVEKRALAKLSEGAGVAATVVLPEKQTADLENYIPPAAHLAMVLTGAASGTRIRYCKVFPIDEKNGGFPIKWVKYATAYHFTLCF